MPEAEPPCMAFSPEVQQQIALADVAVNGVCAGFGSAEHTARQKLPEWQAGVGECAKTTIDCNGCDIRNMVASIAAGLENRNKKG